MAEKKKTTTKKTETKKQDAKKEAPVKQEVKKQAAKPVAAAPKPAAGSTTNRRHVSVSSSATAVPTLPGRWISLPYRNMQKPSRM